VAKKKLNHTDLPLGSAILQDLSSSLWGAVEEVENDQKVYEAYQRDPAGFGRDILNETFTDDIVEVMNSVRDYPITIAKSANATGKTHGAARVIAYFYKCFKGAQVYSSAPPPEDNLRRLLWGEIGSMVEKNPHVFSDDHCKVNSLRIARSANEFIVGVTVPQSGTPKQREAKFSGKHAPYILFVLDEGDAIPAEVYRGIESCMSGGFARLLIMFNPRHQSGHVYQMEVEKRANVVVLSAFNHPNVVTGKDVIPGAVTREVTVSRINRWTRPMYKGERVDDACFEVPPFLVGCTCLTGDPNGASFPPLKPGWRKVVEPEFSYMVLGRYPEMMENQLINRSWIEEANARWTEFVSNNGERGPIGVKPRLGCDIADLGGDINSVAIRAESFIYRPLKWSGVDPLVSAEEISGIYKNINACEAYVDANGVGAAVPAILRRLGCVAHRIMSSGSSTTDCEHGEFDRMRDQGYWTLREWLRTDPRAMLPPDEGLKEELLAMQYHRTKTGKIKVTAKEAIRDRLKRSPDTADSVMLTFTTAPEEANVGSLSVRQYI